MSRTAVLTADLSMCFVADKLGRGTMFQRPAAAAIVLLLSAASLTSLGRHHAVPKQPYRASLTYAASERRPGEIVVAIHTARRGCSYYAEPAGFREDEDFFLADSLETLETVLSAHGREGGILITSMPRALHLVRPEMEARIEEGWQVARTFPATIGDGQISVWRQRQR